MMTMRAGQFRISLDLLGQPEAVQGGHVGIGEHKMDGLRSRGALFERRERLNAIRGHAGLHAPGGKRLIQHPPICGIVIHNQNRHAAQRHRRGSLRLDSGLGPSKSRREVEGTALAGLALHPDPSLHHGHQAR